MSPATPSRPTVPLLRVLSQETSPERLALSVALGVAISCFPIFGTTTILCALVALVFRLSLPAIQVGNYLALPLQLVLFIPFLRLGERLSRSSPLPLSATRLLAMARSAPDQTMHMLLSGQWHSILGWLVVAPAMAVVLVVMLRPMMRFILARVRSRSESSLAAG